MHAVIDDTNWALNVQVFKQLLQMARWTVFNTWNSSRCNILFILLPFVQMNSSGGSKDNLICRVSVQNREKKSMYALKNGMKSWQHVRYRFFNTSRRHEKLIKLFSIRAAFHHHVKFFSPGSLSSDWTTTLTALGHKSYGKLLLFYVHGYGTFPNTVQCVKHTSALYMYPSSFLSPWRKGQEKKTT